MKRKGASALQQQIERLLAFANEPQRIQEKLREIIAELAGVLATKGDDYADTQDVWVNFRMVAEIMNGNAERVVRMLTDPETGQASPSLPQILTAIQSIAAIAKPHLAGDCYTPELALCATQALKVARWVVQDSPRKALPTRYESIRDTLADLTNYQLLTLAFMDDEHAAD